MTTGPVTPVTAPTPVQSLEVMIVGTPAPQGSKRGFVRGGRAVLVESSAKVAPWRQDVAAAVTAAMVGGSWPLTGPLMVQIAFRLHRPASAPKSRQAPFQRPDLDKLIRSTFDAIGTAGAWVDDAQVVEVSAIKSYALPGQATGAVLLVSPWSVTPW